MIPKIGYIASAWATLSAYGTMSILSFWLGKKYYKVPYQTFKIVFYIFSSALTSYFIFTYFLHNYPIKILILFSYILMVLVIERQQLKQLIK
jgi:O-antigen/teichoic acid export membrane protein